MRGGICNVVLAITSLMLLTTTFAQQYLGDVIPNSLPNVPGSEVAYFHINDPTGRSNLTLINYYTHQDNGQRIVESEIMRAVVIIHGLDRDPNTYVSNMMVALAQLNSDPNINRSTVAIMAPYFPNGDDKNYGYPWTSGLSPGHGSTTNCLVWPGSQWSAGGNNQYPYTSTNTSSYTVLDQLIQYFDNTNIFPNMKQIVIAGHSLGGQTVQRYAAIGQPATTKSAVSYWVANPDSYAWFSTSRPLLTTGCPIYDVYREGYTNFTLYPMTYGVALVKSGRSNILANYNSKAIAYGRGTQDLGDDASTCAAETTGNNRNERFFNFIQAFPVSCPNPTGRNCDTIDYVNAGHDAGAMMSSQAGQARLFTDNFYGNGNRSYDFGYPREQAGDDPYPNPALNGTTAAVNNNTYAGNMTYWGCWTDQSPQTLKNQSYSSNANTIETCTSTCAQGGNTIAGIEDGTQCFCGSSLGYLAQEVVESSCQTPCPGNSTESCGGSNRLSIFSNGRPVVQSAPGTPEAVDGFYYINCYTEATSGRALQGSSTSGSFMTLEYCANYCNGFQYFGTEYSAECYCGNSFAAGANIASDSDCNMLCANNTAEYCGGPNRLTVFQYPDWTPPSTSTTSTLATTGTGTAPTAVACPASNNTVVTSNGRNFTIECAIDHYGGDLTSTSVNSFQGCIDACGQNSQCVDVSLSGNACYLKSSLGVGTSNAGIWGAKLVSGPASATTTSSSTSSTSVTLSTSSTSVTTSSTSSSSASPTATPVSWPGSNSTIYTASNGETFLIECGIAHAGGDMGSASVSGFADCVEACAALSACVDVSLSGSACYMKSTLGAPVQNGVWGAKLVSSSSSSSSQTSSLTSSSTGLSSVTTTGLSTSATLSTSSLTPASSSSAPSVSSPTASPSSGSGGQSTSTTSSASSNTALPIATTSSDSSSLTANTNSPLSSTSGSSSVTQTSSVSSTSLASATASTASTAPSPTSTSSSSTALSTSSSSATALPSGFSYLGCFVDSTASRALPSANGSSTNQTPQQCALNCRANGYKYSGTEYSSECWCGNSEPATSASASDCNMSCSGDKTQSCGAGNRLSVVVDNTWKQTFFAAQSYETWTLMGCYVDSTSSRMFPNSISLSAYGGGSNATIGNCMNACANEGYTYCGEEYYSECYGGNASPPSSALATGADALSAGCKLPCNGNSTEACGGSNRLQVYINNGTSA